jgi:hypothetical protein
MSRRTVVLWVTAVTILGSVVAGCSGGPTVTSSPDLVDPSRTSRESGSTDDIYDAVTRAITSMMASERVLNQPGNRVVLNNIENNTGISGYDERVIYNRFLSNLINSGGDKLVFLSRESVEGERQKQLSGEVKTSGVEAVPAGADMALDIELLQIPGATTQTIQYTFRLTNLDGIIVWQDSFEIKKKR